MKQNKPGRPKSKISVKQYREQCTNEALQVELFRLMMWLRDVGILKAKMYNVPLTRELDTLLNQIMLLDHSKELCKHYTEWCRQKLVWKLDCVEIEDFSHYLGDKNIDENYINACYRHAMDLCLTLVSDLVIPAAAKRIANQNTSEEIRDTLWIIEDMKRRGMKTTGLDEALESFPNDLVRKLRKPTYSRRKITRLLIALKDMSGPLYVSRVAEELEIGIDELLQMCSEAMRQKRKITISKDSTGRELIVL